MVILIVPGDYTGKRYKVKKDIVFTYQPTNDVQIGVWKHKDYQVQVSGHGNVYTIAHTETPELAYASQRAAKKLLDSGAKVVITGLTTAKIEKLEDKLKKK